MSHGHVVTLCLLAVMLVPESGAQRGIGKTHSVSQAKPQSEMSGGLAINAIQNPTADPAEDLASSAGVDKSHYAPGQDPLTLFGAGTNAPSMTLSSNAPTRPVLPESTVKSKFDTAQFDRDRHFKEGDIYAESTGQVSDQASFIWNHKGLLGFDGIMVINLDSRPDRLEQFYSTMATAGISKDNITRIPGVVFGKGRVEDGCTQAHLNALIHAIREGWNNYAVFEDDFTWISDSPKMQDTVLEGVNSAMHDLSRIPKGWDMLMISGRVEGSEEYHPSLTRVLRVIRAKAASGYIVNRGFYNEFKDLLYGYLQKHPEHDEGMPIDELWMPLQKRRMVFVAQPKLGRQRAGTSDLRGGDKVLDYGDGSMMASHNV